jgi:hypothetical protein
MPQTNWTDGKLTLVIGRTLTGHRLSARFEKAAENAIRLKTFTKIPMSSQTLLLGLLLLTGRLGGS